MPANMVTATALIVHELNAPFQVETVELDTLRPNEVLVRLKATSICATDGAVQHGKFPIPFPAVFGHEGILIPPSLSSFLPLNIPYQLI